MLMCDSRGPTLRPKSTFSGSVPFCFAFLFDFSPRLLGTLTGGVIYSFSYNLSDFMGLIGVFQDF